ncbi:MAG: zinc ribbon domain-containing protein [Dehalococcoidia bacterium]|nr:zinc ribbon domain-containing protein [Dehalococcoidia bacterium]
MPAYDFRCEDCKAVTSIFTRSVKTEIHPVCEKCKSTNMTQMITGFVTRIAGASSSSAPGSFGANIEDRFREMGMPVPPELKQRINEVREGGFGGAGESSTFDGSNTPGISAP